MLRAIVQHVDGFHLVGKSNSNHWVSMDGSVTSGGEDSAPRPKELLLLALGGCTAFDIHMVLEKRRVQPKRFTIELEADEAGEHPMVFTEIRMTYQFEGDLPVADLERAIRLSQDKYCSVSAMLRRVCPIRWRAMLDGREVLAGESSEAKTGAA
jgi:putative redox protein